MKQETWASIKTSDPDVAAAFATLGVPVRISVQVQERTGKEAICFYLASESVTMPAIKTGFLLRLLKDKKLESTDAMHPLLFALSGIKSWHALKSGKPCVLVQTGLSGRAVYVREAIVPVGVTAIALVGSMEAHAIVSLDFVAAAGTCGLPAIRTADGGFKIADASLPPFDDNYTALRHIEAGQMQEEHGFCYARRGIENRQALTTGIEKAKRLVYVQKRGTQRTAHVREDITNEGLDTMKRFLNGGVP